MERDMATPVNPVLIDGQWVQEENAPTFSAVNPRTREPLPEAFPISNRRTVERLVAAAAAAAPQLREVEPERIAAFLEQCATNLEAKADELVKWANLETALPVEPRLRNVELPRTTNQLRLAAKAVRERAFCEPIIDTRANLRSVNGSLGAPVVVFGPNNFPFAFNAVMGGDFASAIAAGNPVIAKVHPGHPKTSQLLAECAWEAVKATGLPSATFQMIYELPRELGFELVTARPVAALAFTGSRPAGLALKQAAESAGKLAYLELSSINPIFFLPGAIAERGKELASELFSSCAMGAGQFCTSPGVSVVVDSEATREWLRELQALFAGSAPGALLSASAPDNLASSVKVLEANGASVLTGGKVKTDGPYAFENTLLEVRGEQFLNAPEALQTEAFGTVHLVVVVSDKEQLVAVARALEGNLTGCIYSAKSGEDDALYVQVEKVLRYKVGRLLNDKMPTGVAVSDAMQHGGPFPSTGHPGFTAVGMPSSIRRFVARHAYDGVRPHRLPPELANENPLGIYRNVDGTWSREPITA
jgi:alpha-ketoglutaric semialdehyde dehydrogenase